MYASKEEQYFAGWLDELLANRIITAYEYEPEPFVLLDKVVGTWDQQLKTKVKTKNTTLFQQVIYTTDFKVTWNTEKSDGLLTYTDGKAYQNKPLFYLPEGVNETYFEVKPNFDANNMTRAARIKIAWVMDKYSINVELVKPQKLFKETFYPQIYLMSDSGKSPRRKAVNGLKGKKMVPLHTLSEVLDVKQFLTLT